MFAIRKQNSEFTYNSNEILKVVEEFHNELYHSDIQTQNEARKDIVEIMSVTKNQINKTNTNVKRGKDSTTVVDIINDVREIDMENK